MVWTCAEQRLWMYYTKDFECGAARQEGKGKTTQKVWGCSGGHKEDAKDRVRQMIQLFPFWRRTGVWLVLMANFQS